MFQIIGETHIDFMKSRVLAVCISGAVILAGIISLAAHGGPRYSIDFAGGRLVDLAFVNQPVPASDVRASLARIGLGDAEVQQYEAGAAGEHSGVVVRFKEETTIEGRSVDEVSPTPAIIRALEEDHPGLEVDLRREESVGPKVGAELRNRAIQSITYALILILVYVGFRFELVYGLGGVVALFHDVFVVVGVFSLLNREISLTVVAALLTIAGFSINDTVVIFDRIRELRKTEQRRRIRDVMNLAINQTLSRTFITSFTVLMTALSLFFFGGPVIRDFALAMLIGLVSGTYSTIYVATAIALWLIDWREARKARKAALQAAAS